MPSEFSENKNIEKQKTDYYLEALAITILVITWMISIRGYLSLPQTIPTHFNDKGVVDGYGNKFSILILPFVYSFVFLLLTIVNNFPKSFNYPVKITEQNAAFQQRLICRFIRALKVSCGIAILFLNWVIITSAQKNSLPFGDWFIVLVILPIILPIVVYVIIALKNK
jgi:uncharacterized membrane protein